MRGIAIPDVDVVGGKVVARPRRSKYRAQPTTVDGVRFASKREANRDGELHNLQRAGLISDLQRQQAFPLKVNGYLVATYVADWTYRDAAGNIVVEDAKGFSTKEFILKSRLLKALTGIEVALS